MKLRLAELREGKLSQGQIAEIANVTLKTEWNWENGKTFPNAEQVFAICTALGCSPNDLLGWSDDESPAATRDEKELLHQYRASTVERQSILINTARDFARVSEQDE